MPGRTAETDSDQKNVGRQRFPCASNICVVGSQERHTRQTQDLGEHLREADGRGRGGSHGVAGTGGICEETVETLEQRESA